MNQSEYIDLLRKSCKTKYGELLVECMEDYNVTGLRELTEEQLKEFCERKGLIK